MNQPWVHMCHIHPESPAHTPPHLLIGGELLYNVVLVSTV